MTPRPLTEAAAVKQLKTLAGKLAKQGEGAKRLALLRRQADLGDQRDAAAERTRQEGIRRRAAADEPAPKGRGSYWD